MTKLKCLVVDDELIARRIISSHINNTPSLTQIGECKNAIEAHHFLKEKDVDIMFLDLEMPKLKGFDFLDLLEKPPVVIITTAHREFALEGFEHGVLDYLLKPISLKRFHQAIDKVITTKRNSDFQDQVITFKSDRTNIRLQSSKILFIEGMSNYIQIHTEDRKYTVYSSLTNIKNQLPSHFSQVHKSYIINRLYLSAYTHDKLNIGEKSIPLGKKYKNEILDILKKDKGS